jgi:hypothetical protein
VLLGGDGKHDDRVGGRAVADPGLLARNAETAVDAIGPRRQQFRMCSDFRFGDRYGERETEPFGSLRGGAEV